MAAKQSPRRETGGQFDGAGGNVKAIVTAELLDISNERDRQLEWRHQAWRDGWQAGHETSWNAGYLQCASDVKRAEHGIYDHLARAAELERNRWRLRGQFRTRQTFGQPHPADFTGRGAA